MDGVEVTKIRTHDGAPAYLLPGGTVVTVEGWESIEPAFLAQIIADDAAR